MGLYWGKYPTAYVIEETEDGYYMADGNGFMLTADELLDIAKNITKFAKLHKKDIEEFNIELSDEFKETKEQIEQRLKDNIQKISALLDKPQDTSGIDKQNSNIDNLSNKVQEYLSNFEFWYII